MADPKDKKDPKKDEKKEEKKDLGQAKDYRKKEKHRKGAPSGIPFAGRGFVTFMFIVVAIFALIFGILSLYGEGAERTNTASEKYSAMIGVGEEAATVWADNTTLIYTNSNQPFFVIYDSDDGDRGRQMIPAGKGVIDYTCRTNMSWSWIVQIEGIHDSTNITFNVVRGVKRRRS